MRETRDIVDAAYAVRMALAAVGIERAVRTKTAQAVADDDQLPTDVERMKQLAVALAERLKLATSSEAGGTPAGDDELLQRIARLSVVTTFPDGEAATQQTLSDAERWSDDIV